MKKILISLTLFLSLMSVYSCSEDSVQQKIESEKADRVEYVKNFDYKQTNTGLYYLTITEGTGDILSELTIKQLNENNSYPSFKYNYAFYHLDGRVIKSNYLYGYFEPESATYSFNPTSGKLKVGLNEALGMMKVGGKMRVVMSTSLYNDLRQLPPLNIEPMRTREYESVICDIELKEVSQNTNPDLE
ncbi:MAG: hypothetical protein WBG43_07375 [Marinifilaceae bacterium]